MDERALVDKWLSVFGEGVDKQIMKENVCAPCNYLWHVFTWGNVAALAGEDARRAFDALSYTEAIRFCDGYSCEIRDVSVVGRLSAENVETDGGRDVYITATDFSWTYVRTHEEGLGPYLCVKK